MDLFYPFIDFVATHLRPLAMVFFVLPLSFLLRQFIFLSQLISFNSPHKHSTRVIRVANQIKHRYHTQPNTKPFLCTARAPWQNLSTRFATYKQHSHCINVSDFNTITHFSPQNLTVTTEPLVEVGQITNYLIQRGYMLATTLEIKEATIGGLAMAVGMTTASHKFGLLQETVLEYEVVLATGEVVKCTKDNQYSDLFYAIPWSHGSLCLLLSLTLKIIPVTNYVKLEYIPFKNTETQTFCDKIISESVGDADFVEATVFSRRDCVVMTAKFVTDSDVDKDYIYNPSTWYEKWFYLHIRSKLLISSNERRSLIEYIPTKDYIFRHDRGIFWTLRDQLPEDIGNSMMFRYLLGWLCPPKVTFLKLPATPKIKEEMMFHRVYQDIVLPTKVMARAIAKAADLFEIWPILVYPSRIYNTKGQFRTPKKEYILPGKNYAMYFDLGVYGIPDQIKRGIEGFNIVQSMREMEEFTREVGGAPFLYADTFMTREEFQKMFDLELYESVRKKYHCDGNFPHLYDKTSGCQSFDWKSMIPKDGKTS